MFLLVVEDSIWEFLIGLFGHLLLGHRVDGNRSTSGGIGRCDLWCMSVSERCRNRLSIREFAWRFGSKNVWIKATATAKHIQAIFIPQQAGSIPVVRVRNQRFVNSEENDMLRRSQLVNIMSQASKRSR